MSAFGMKVIVSDLLPPDFFEVAYPKMHPRFKSFVAKKKARFMRRYAKDLRDSAKPVVFSAYFIDGNMVVTRLMYDALKQQSEAL